MKNIFLVTVFWAIGLSGCSQSDNAERTPGSNAERTPGSYEREGKRAVRAKLRDANSAQFRKVFTEFGVYKGKRVAISCGEVNAKNAFGAYVGFDRYVYINFVAAKKSLTYLESDTADFETIRILCL